MQQVTQHMETVDRNLYSELLLSPDVKINNTAKSFMEGSVEIRRIMKQYLSRWCSKKDKRFVFGTKGRRYAQFLEDSDAMFLIILDRIQKETESLYPLVRQLNAEQQHVA